MFFVLSDKFVAIWQTVADSDCIELILYELKSGHKTVISVDKCKAESDDKSGHKFDYSLICGNFSQNSKHLAVCDNRRQLIVFEDNDNRWRHLFTTKVDRNCIKILFAIDRNSVICGHKSGDVFEHQFESKELQTSAESRLLLGHCSMLLDVMQTPDSKYLITCDRDEKIRVSRYPNAYNIESYCLGHKEFVSSLAMVDEKTLISGSGDGSLRIWDVKDGKEINLFMCETNESIEDNRKIGTQFAIKKVITNAKTNPNLLSVSFYKQPIVKIYSIESQSLKLCHTLSLDEEPIDICFDQTNRSNILWVLLPTKDSPLNGYQIGTEVTKSNTYESIVEEINQNQEFVKQCLNGNTSRELEGLYKHWFNNVETYLQKKSERQEVMAKKKKFRKL